MSKPLASPSIVRPIRATDRRTGAALMLVPSATVEGKFHVTAADRCDCAGFGFRGTCSHLSQVQRELGLQNGGAADMAVRRASGNWPPAISSPALAATYREIWG